MQVLAPVRVLWLPFLLAATGPAQFLPETRVTTGVPPGTAAAFAPAIARAADVVGVAFGDERTGDYEVFFNRSLLRGSAFPSSPVQVSARGPLALGSLNSVQLLGRGDHWLCVWSDQRQGLPASHGARNSDVWFAHSFDGGRTFQEQRISNTAAGALFLGPPRLCASADGSHVYCAWSYPGAQGIPVNASHDGGVTWQGFDQLVTGGLPGWGPPAMVCSDDGRHVCIAFRARAVSVPPGAPNGYDIFVAVSHDFGATFTAPLRVDTGDAAHAWDSWDPQLAGAGAHVYCVWYDNRPPGSATRHSVQCNLSADHGATWLPAAVVLDADPLGATDSLEPIVAAAGAHVYVAWNERSTGDLIAVNHSADRGSTWQPAPSLLNPPGAGRQSDPRLQATGPTAFVAWDTWQSEVHVCATVDGGSTWSLPIRLDAGDPAVTQSAYPVVATDGEDVQIAFADRRSGIWDVYCAAGRLPHLAFAGPLASGNPVHYVLQDEEVGGALGLVLISGSGATPGTGGIPIPGSNRELDLVHDFLTDLGLANAGLHLLGPVVGGQAVTPTLALPVVPPGLPLWAAAVVLDPASARFVSFTRPIAFVTR